MLQTKLCGIFAPAYLPLNTCPPPKKTIPEICHLSLKRPNLFLSIRPEWLSLWSNNYILEYAYKVVSNSLYDDESDSAVPCYMCIMLLSANAGRSLRRRQNFTSRSTGSRDLLQRAVGLQLQRRTLFVRKAQCAQVPSWQVLVRGKCRKRRGAR